MINFRPISTALIALCLAAPGTASAKCTRAGDLICGRGEPAIASNAPLQVSRGGDFAAIAPGAALRGGDRVLIGATEARLTLGPSCQAEVGPGSLVSIRRTDGRTCALVSQQPSQAGLGATEPGGLDPTIVGAGVLAGGAGLVALGIALENNNGGGGGTVSSR